MGTLTTSRSSLKSDTSLSFERGSEWSRTLVLNLVIHYMHIYFDDLRRFLFERELGLKQSTNHILRMTRSILQNAYLKSEQIKIFNIFCISQDANLAAPPLMAV